MKSDRRTYLLIAAIFAVLGLMVLIAFVRLPQPAAPVPPSATATAVTAPSATGTAPSPEPTPLGAPAILQKPVVSDPPSQVEAGSLTFWGVCMACHGNEGQGLTDEWRELAFGEDKDCWTSKCHAANHPPQGFEFPKLVPALVGGGRLGRFTSAQQLYDYVVAMMPWWNPGSLTPETGWQVTAFLLKLNGTLPDGLVLDQTVASAVPIHRQLSLPQNDTRLALILSCTLILTLLGVLLKEALVPPARRRPSFVAHLHPPAIPLPQARWRYTLGAGGFALFLCLVLAATGLLEMFYYVPTPEKAALSVETIHFFVPLGALVRNLHYWSAQILVIIAGVHLLRVVFTGAYARPRRFNFVLGTIIFVFVLLLDFTGYVLRWDEGIRWALTAGTNLLSAIPVIGRGLFIFIVGGSQTGPATLVRFYAWHIFALSVAAAAIIIWHVFRVRRDGGISAPPQTGPRLPRADLVRRELVAMLVGGALLLLLATFVQAPIAGPLQTTPDLTSEARAPWFFLWVQQLLKLGDPFLLGVLVPLIVITIVGLVPYLLPGAAPEELGTWFPRRGRVAQILLTLLTLTILGLTLLALIPAANV